MGVVAVEKRSVYDCLRYAKRNDGCLLNGLPCWLSVLSGQWAHPGAGEP